MSSFKYCPNYAAAFLTTTPDGKKLAVAGRCKQWTCAFCAEKNRAKWTAVLIDHVNKSKDSWSWFTLTAHSSAHKSVNPARYTLLNIRNAWDKLIKRMRRKYGKFEYCRVYEQHKSGAFHVHCIRQGVFDDIVVRNEGKENEYSDSVWLRSVAKELKLGYMTHADNIGRAKAGLVAFYVVKYMTKLESMEDWHGVRRIQTSRGIKYNTPSEYTWKIKSGLYLDDLNTSGDNWYLINEGRELNSDDFNETYVWPPNPTGKLSTS